MPEFGWRSPTSVEAWLQSQPYSFNFFQAVKILEVLSPKSESPGTTSDPEREPVRFRSSAGLEFPPSDICEIRKTSGPARNLAPEMTVAFLGLAGALGPLPLPDTERLIELIRRKDFAFRDFLDVFHHRLLSLFYRVRKTHHPALTQESPQNTPLARYLYSFFGLGPHTLRRSKRIPDERLLYYAGLLSQQPRSAVGLERILADHFPLPVDSHHREEHRPLPIEIRQFSGEWYRLEPDQWTRIGLNGQNQQVGNGVVLGTRVWNQSARFEVRLGPMPISQFLDFLPSGTAFRPLCEITRFYAGQEFDFTFRLVLQRGDVPPLQLGQARLGWTSWIRERPFSQDASQVHLDPGRISVS